MMHRYWYNTLRLACVPGTLWAARRDVVVVVVVVHGGRRDPGASTYPSRGARLNDDRVTTQSRRVHDREVRGYARGWFFFVFFVFFLTIGQWKVVPRHGLKHGEGELVERHAVHHVVQHTPGDFFELLPTLVPSPPRLTRHLAQQPLQPGNPFTHSHVFAQLKA